MTPTDTNPSLRQRLPLYPGQFICAVVMVSIGPLLDSMMRDTNIPLAQGGMISAGLFIGEVIGIVVLNLFLARLPAQWALVTGAVLQGVALLAAGLISRDLYSLFTAYLVAGIGWALVNTIGWMWIPAHVREGTASAVTLLSLFYAFGMLVAPVILGVAVDAGVSWRIILDVEGAAALLLAVTLAVMPLADIPDRHNVRLHHLGSAVRMNPRLLFGMVVGGFMYVGAEMTLNIWLPKFQLDTFGGGDAWASLSVTLFWVGLVAGRIIVMPLTRRFAPSRILAICSCALAVMALGIAVAPTQRVSLLLVVGAGLGASASFGMIGSYAREFPGWYCGIASSIFVLATGVASVVFPYVTGPVASAGGFRLAIAVAAAPAAICGLLSFPIHRYSRESRAAHAQVLGE